MLASLPSLSTILSAGFASIADNGLGTSVATLRYIANETGQFLDAAYGKTLTTVTGFNSFVSGFLSASVGQVQKPDDGVAANEAGEPVSIYHAGGGDDVVHTAQSKSQVVDGGSDTDTVNYDHFTSAITITLNKLESAVPFTALVERGVATKQFLFDFEKIVATDFDDRLVLRDLSTLHDGLTIEGGLGQDTIDAREALKGVKIDLENAYRESLGLAPVQLDAKTMAAAASHSMAMASANSMSHDVGSSFSSRLAAHGIGRGKAVENIAMGQLSFDETFEAWKGSSGHDANLRASGVTKLGVGVARGPSGPA